MKIKRETLKRFFKQFVGFLSLSLLVEYILGKISSGEMGGFSPDIVFHWSITSLLWAVLYTKYVRFPKKDSPANS